MRGAASCLEVMLAQGANVMSTDGAGTACWAPGEGGGFQTRGSACTSRQAPLHGFSDLLKKRGLLSVPPREAQGHVRPQRTGTKAVLWHRAR